MRWAAPCAGSASAASPPTICAGFVVKRLHQLAEPDLGARIESLSADEFECICGRLSEHQAEQPPLP
jgi:hypothetical protein